MNDKCGVSSFFMFASEIPFGDANFHSYAAPAGSTRRPIIAQQTLNTIGQALQNSLRYHEANKDYFDETHIVCISNLDAMSIIKKYMREEDQHSSYEEIKMFANSLK